jgi:MarR family transcriptional regulator, lower aerobic nicotinate degradation pathway regulator
MTQSSRSANAIGEVLDAVRRLVHAIRSSARRTEQELGISGAQLFVLQQLADRPADSLNQLAERTYTHQSSTSVVVRRLVDRGLVSRRPSRQDGRRLEIALSSSGRALLRRSGPAVQTRLLRAMRRLSPGQQRRLASSLRLLIKGMGLAGMPAPMIFTDMQS